MHRQAWAVVLRQHRAVRYLLFALILLIIAIGIRVSVNMFERVSRPSAAEGRTGARVDTESIIAQMQDRIESEPADADAYAQLGQAYLARVRETGDAAHYARAQAAFEAALDQNPKQVDGLVGQGMLALARHDFADALEWADRARAALDFELPAQQANILSIEVDGLVELGRYDEAVAAAQTMIDLRPDLSAYSRVSYLRELHGDMEGAVAAMEQAAQYGAPGSEPRAWTVVQLGYLFFNQGNLEQALTTYQRALQEYPEYAYAQAAIASVWAAQDKTEAALEQYHAVLDRLPMAEFAMELGELYLALDREDAAMDQFALVRVIQDLNRAAGMNVDLDMALFMADHAERLGIDSARIIAQAEATYAERPTIYAADALAWALYRSGDAENLATARTYSEEALRLNTQDAMLYYHAGMIAHALGDHSTARIMLEQALAINPHFSPLYGPIAQELLSSLIETG